MFCGHAYDAVLLSMAMPWGRYPLQALPASERA